MSISKMAMIVFFISVGVEFFWRAALLGTVIAVAALVAGFALAFDK